MPTNEQNNPTEDLLSGDDEELAKRIAWEEEIEKRYGGDEEKEMPKKPLGPGFSQQKKRMEASRYYQGGKKKLRVVDKTKK